MCISPSRVNLWRLQQVLEQRLDAPSSAKEAMGLLKQQEHGKGEGLAV